MDFCASRKRFAAVFRITWSDRDWSRRWIAQTELYWELLDADDQGVVTLGASYNRGGSEGTYQAADVLYYASGGYYVALTLYQLWPVTVEGKPSTLVWRGDMISSASLGSLRGVERLGSESVMMKNITKAVTLFRERQRRPLTSETFRTAICSIDLAAQLF
jgi:hypothetical protein